MNAPQEAMDFELRRIEEAERWLQILHEGAFDEGTIAAWQKWSSDAPNLQEFERLQQIWEGVGDLESGRLLTSSAAGSRRWAPQWAWAAGLTLLIGASSSVYWIKVSGDRTYDTRVAVTRELPLPDGSRVEIAPLSRINTRFTPESRIVNVESGEAYFNVARDPLRPFIVKVGEMQVLAVGTAFNVHKTGERVRVTVTDGVISASATKANATGDNGAHATAPVQASAGQQVEYSLVDRRFLVGSADVARATAWRSGMLKFVNEPLGSVVADLNRYSDRRIVIDDAALETLPYTGTVFAGRVDQWLLALQDAFPLHAQVDGADRVRLKMN